jgi:hypothetical protein
LQKDFLKSLTDEIQFIIPRGLTVLFFKSKVNWFFSIIRTMCFVIFSLCLQIKAASTSKLVRRLIGSSAPDCGHACGACSPCKIRTVSYECSNDVGSHAEACPLGYLCICHGRTFPIP